MKKVLLSVIALVVALLCLTACNSYASTLQDIQALLKVDYSKVVLNVTTTVSDITLNGNYTLTFEGDQTTVEYAFDKLNELSLDGNNEGGYLTRVTGRGAVVNGNVVEGDTSIELPQEISFNGISFKQAFFSNYSMTGAKFEADVTNPKGFTGNNNLVCTNMHVTVKYSKTALNIIDITYISEKGASVSITYTFTK